MQDQSSVSNVEELIPSALHHASTGSGHSPDSTTSVEISQNPHARPRPSYTTISRSVSAQSVPVRHETEAQVPFTGVDSREDQGTTTPVDIGLHDVQITRITASLMPSRPTILSRLASRFSRRPQDPDPAAASLTHDSDSLHLTRRRLSRLMLRRTLDGSASDSFLSVIESSAHGSSTTPVRSRRRRDLTSISRPIPVQDETLVGTSTADSVSPAPRPLDSSTRRIITSAPPRPEHRHTRLSRLRHSMTFSFDNILLGRSPRLHCLKCKFHRRAPQENHNLRPQISCCHHQPTLILVLILRSLHQMKLLRPWVILRRDFCRRRRKMRRDHRQGARTLVGRSAS